MDNKFEKILDECINRIGHGESIKECLNDYPEYAKELEPLLNTFVQTKTAFPFTPSADGNRTARARFYAALDKRRQRSLWERVLFLRPVWITATTILLIAIIILITYRLIIKSEIGTRGRTPG